MIEAQLSPQGEPVLGLYLHVAYHRSCPPFGRKVGRGEVTPAIIGVVAMLAECPGISQATLARRIGLERATIGTHGGAGDCRRLRRADGRPRRRPELRAVAVAARRTDAADAAPPHRRTRECRRCSPDRRTSGERLRALLHKLVYG